MKELQLPAAGLQPALGGMHEIRRLDDGACALIEEMSRMLHRLRVRVESAADFRSVAPGRLSVRTIEMVRPPAEYYGLKPPLPS